MVMQLVEEAGSSSATRIAPHGVAYYSSFFFANRRSPNAGVLQLLFGVAFLFASFGQIPDARCLVDAGVCELISTVSRQSRLRITET